MHTTKTPNNTPAFTPAVGGSSSSTERIKLAQVAIDNEVIIPKLLKRVPGLDRDTEDAIVYDSDELGKDNVDSLNHADCPGYKDHKQDPVRVGTEIFVWNMDTIDTALMFEQVTDEAITTVAEQTKGSAHLMKRFTEHAKQMKRGEMLKQGSTSDIDDPPPKPILILNCCCEETPGGKWREGLMGQEEELFYRTSLSYSLDKKYYPLDPLKAIYSPKVFVIRRSYKEGHETVFPMHIAKNDQPDLLFTQVTHTSHNTGNLSPPDFKVFSVLSIPSMAEPPFGHNDMYFLRMKQKIRMILRIAAKHGHTKLVLGNLGSGDGAEDAAKSFLEVFQEDEFQGGWWEYVFFAVMDKSKNAGPGDDRTYGALDGEVV